MKIIKRTAFTILFLVAIGLLFRGWTYRKLITYKSVGIRTNYTATDNKLITYIDTSVDKETESNIEQIIKAGLSITSTKLYFTTGKNETNPNKLISSRRANCVGYASFFATACIHLLEKYDLANTWTVKSHVGQLYFLGNNVHQYFHSQFYKDHDFVTIENVVTGQIFAVDPTVNDYLFIDFVTFDK